MSDGTYELEAAVEAAPVGETVDVSVNCVRCGYDLKGLARTGKCPECGTVVERSLMGDNLVYSSPEYVAKLQRGLSFILNAILVMVINVVLSVAAGAAGLLELGHFVNIVGIGVGLALVAGWWMFSEEDPAYVGKQNGSTARRVVRVVVLIELATTILSASFAFVQVNLSAPSGMAIAAGAIALAGLVVGAVKFFAGMLYVRWLAPRIPSDYVRRRATLLMWLCPLLVTVGAIALMLGPLIALVLYWNLLNRVRAEIKVIRQRQVRFA